ncbi:ABC transporter permease [Streptococcus pneumoniae]|nr:ABC transporter permease [Streptococcus pneumoniae]CZD52261.1 ABC transporter permease [Streptococcus pneumoniae]VIP89142.1 ABC transporter permease [Streptococcus pneumoniae]VMD87123.1 ABC transporter permease [Streptococcus pneumoniae]VMU63080.1 ABC transporter permease [Streptococcus pneumoniae]
MNFVLSSLSEGLLWSIMAIGVYLTFRILDIADMTAEGAFPLGAAVVVSQIQAGANPWLATLLALLARYGSRSCIRNAPHQDENPSSLDRALFNQY